MVNRAESRTDPVFLELFGGPSLRTPAGARVELTPRQRALLTLVWGHEERGIPRRRAIWLLWEAEDGPRPRQRLRQALHELRGRIGDPAADFGTDEYLVAGSGWIRSDLEDFGMLLRSGQLTRALALLRKGFASKLQRIPGREFEDWLEAKRVALRRSLHDRAAELWDSARVAGDWKAAREAAEALHALDQRGDESALRKVVEARVMTGNQEAAVAALVAHRESLSERDALEPETEILLARVRRMDGSAPAPSHFSREPLPLVGRLHDLDTAREALRSVKSGRFEFLLVQGEAGVGKTRLLEEVRREALLGGFRCLRARPVELEQKIPLNPLIDALSEDDIGHHVRALDDPWRAVIASVLPELPAGMERPVVPPIAESGLSRRLYDAFSFLFGRLAAEEPTVLFLDDLQWADDTTIAVLQFAQRRWQAGPFGVIASLRSDHLPKSGGITKYLQGGQDLPITSIHLQDLGERDAQQLIDLVAEGRLDPPTRSRLCALGGRNPFYLIELTKDYLAGDLQLPDLPNDAVTIPISLRQLVDPRIASLSSGAAATAESLSVWGRWIRLADLAALTGVDVRLCVERLEELERYRLVQVERGMIRLAHELFRGAFYHRMSDSRRALHHRDVARYLQATDQHSVGELALHFSRAGEAEAAATCARTAADEALETGATAEAAHFLQLVTQNVRDAKLKAEATADLARVLHMSREIARANPLLELAAKRLRETGNPARALRMDIRRVEGLAEVGATPMDDLLDRLDSIKTAARHAGDWEALALALDSELHLLHRVGEVPAIRRLFDEIRECASVGDPAAACLANASLALNILFGDGDEALERAREAVRIAEEHCTVHSLRAHTGLYFVLLYGGLAFGSEGSRVLGVARVLAERSGELMLRYYLESNSGVAYLDAGMLDAADTAFDKAARLLVGAEALVPRINHYCNLGELHLARSDFDGATLAFRQAEDLLRSSAAPADVVELINAGIGLCSLHTGHLDEARRREAEVARDAEAWYFDPTIVLAFQSKLLERRGQMEEAVRYLDHHMERIKTRLPPAWMKVAGIRARVAKRARLPDWSDRLDAAIETAEAFGFRVRAGEFRALQTRASRGSHSSGE